MSDRERIERAIEMCVHREYADDEGDCVLATCKACGAILLDEEFHEIEEHDAGCPVTVLQALISTPDAAGEPTWRPIETAPKDKDAPEILLGYAPDEEGYSPPSKEGWWNVGRQRWVWSSDPNYDCPQPTHWMPLPAPPTTEAPNE